MYWMNTERMLQNINVKLYFSWRILGIIQKSQKMNSKIVFIWKYIAKWTFRLIWYIQGVSHTWGGESILRLTFRLRSPHFWIRGDALRDWKWQICVWKRAELSNVTADVFKSYEELDDEDIGDMILKEKFHLEVIKLKDKKAPGTGISVEFIKAPDARLTKLQIFHH